jgi:hypothetical protein
LQRPRFSFSVAVSLSNSTLAIELQDTSSTKTGKRSLRNGPRTHPKPARRKEVRRIGDVRTTSWSMRSRGFGHAEDRNDTGADGASPCASCDVLTRKCNRRDPPGGLPPSSRLRPVAEALPRRSSKTAAGGGLCSPRKRDTRPHSRGAMRPQVVHESFAQENRGRGECRVPVAPAASCAVCR